MPRFLTMAALSALLIPWPSAAQTIGSPVPPSLVPAVERHVVNGPWAARRAATNSCPKLYMLGSRRCPHCRAFVQKAFIPMDRAGYDVRLHTGFMNGEGRAGLAEVAARRNVVVTVTHHLTREANGPPEHRWDDQRVDAFNALIDAQETFSRVSRAAGSPGALPGFLWQDRAGRWRTHSGYGAGTIAALMSSLPTPAAGCADPVAATAAAPAATAGRQTGVRPVARHVLQERRGFLRHRLPHAEGGGAARHIGRHVISYGLVGRTPEDIVRVSNPGLRVQTAASDAGRDQIMAQFLHASLPNAIDQALREGVSR
jgi:hypothetical protein